MKVARGVIGVTALLAACGSSSDAPEPAPGGAATPPAAVPEPPTYSYVELRDSARWEFGALSGTRATLLVRGQTIDMVETSSVQPLPDGSVVYQQVQSLDSNEEECGGPCYEPGQWLLYDGTHRPLDQMLPLFSAVLSAPAVVGDAIYYWGLDGIAGTDSLRITANRYSLPDSTHASVFLFNGALTSDDPSQFARPRMSGDVVEFATFDRRFLTDRAVTSLR